MNILCIGDVVGESGTAYIRKNLPKIKNKHHVDFCIVNGENAAKGNGIDRPTYDELLSAGADVITTGNHVWKKFDTAHFIDDAPLLLRPANYPPCCPGKGYTVVDTGRHAVLVISLLGNVGMTETLESPFMTARRILDKEHGNFDISLIDFHAEATSEKASLGYYLDGDVTALFGTHTHVQTADEKILPRGTAFITDIGMTGADVSVLGVKTDCILRRFLTGMPTRFEEATENITLHGVLITVDDAACQATAVARIVEEA